MKFTLEQWNGVVFKSRTIRVYKVAEVHFLLVSRLILTVLLFRSRCFHDITNNSDFVHRTRGVERLRIPFYTNYLTLRTLYCVFHDPRGVYVRPVVIYWPYVLANKQNVFIRYTGQFSPAIIKFRARCVAFRRRLRMNKRPRTTQFTQSLRRMGKFVRSWSPEFPIWYTLRSIRASHTTTEYNVNTRVWIVAYIHATKEKLILSVSSFCFPSPLVSGSPD